MKRRDFVELEFTLQEVLEALSAQIIQEQGGAVDLDDVRIRVHNGPPSSTKKSEPVILVRWESK